MMVIMSIENARTTGNKEVEGKKGKRKIEGERETLEKRSIMWELGRPMRSRLLDGWQLSWPI